MAKYYLYNIDSGIETFSQFEAGVDFKFKSTTLGSNLKFAKNDLIIGFKAPRTFYKLKVIDYTSNEVSLRKEMEIDSNFGFGRGNQKVVREIEKKEYEGLIKNILNDYSVYFNGQSLAEAPEEYDLKSQFAHWLFEQGKYQRVYKGDIKVLIEKLSEYEQAYSNDHGISIFDYPNLSIEKILDNLESIVIEESGEIGDLNKKTVGNGSVKAILGTNNYVRFLRELLKRQTNQSKVLSPINNQTKFTVSKFTKECNDVGIFYLTDLVIRFASSLLTKSFSLFTGLSGSGKTQLAKLFAQWICQDKSQYIIIPVGADWTNREPLLGYPNALEPKKYEHPDNDALQLFIDAQYNPSLPYFLILDEMNLSHVERYFADFLSAMESDEAIPLHRKGEKLDGVPNEIKIPNNLFIIGTVNIDETTYMFSPKVLDRANTIEFRVSEQEITKFFEESKKIDTNGLVGAGATMAQDFVSKSLDKTASKDTAAHQEFIKFFKELAEVGAEFGYRTAKEMNILIRNLNELGITELEDQIDVAIMQKMLPKLHGSRRKLVPVLEKLGNLCFEKEVESKKVFDKEIEGIKYPISYAKIKRMHKAAIENGFASYAEA